MLESNAMRLLRLKCYLLLALLLSACSQQLSSPPERRWLPTDVRLLDPIDQPDPSLDLIAAYTRRGNQEIQVRLDWLDHAPLPNYDLFLAFDAAPGGATALPNGIRTALAWDLLIAIPAQGELQIYDAQRQPIAAARLRVERDPWLDTLTVRLSEALLPGAGRAGFHLQALLLPSGQDLLADSLGPWFSEALSPPALPLLMAFWDSYPAPTPALALRRWDGAHAGPYGGRHGLGNLLRTAASSGTPLFLLDFKNPTSLAAAELAGHSNQIQTLAQQNLLILPEVLPDPAVSPAPLPVEIYPELLRQNQRAGQQLQLPASPLVFAPGGPFALPGGKTTIILPTTIPPLTPTALQRWRQWRLLPLPGRDSAEAIQASPNGPTLELRQALISAALQVSQDAALLLVLGGSLPESTWGDPLSARATFHYLHSRPWLRFLDAAALQGMPTKSKGALPNLVPDAPALQPLVQALQKAPENVLRAAAWRALQAMVAPTWPRWKELPSARQAMMPAIWSLIAASRWAQNPADQQDCQSDVDQDGLPECVLSSPHFYAQFELPEGTLSFLFVRSAQGTVHQLIGPSTQLTGGLSDPALWVTVHGQKLDPNALPGAFAEPATSYFPYTEREQLQLIAQDGSRRKTYTLNSDQLTIAIRSALPGSPLILQLPLLLDPWLQQVPTWAQHYRTIQTNPTLIWQGGDLQVELWASSPYRWITFLDSQASLSIMENPNLDYPPGHFLPFSLAVAQFQSEGDLDVILTWQTASASSSLLLP